MDIKVREPLYLLSQGNEYVVRQGTNGVERNRVVFFYDTTRTVAVGFSRDYCLENPSTFQVSRNITDKEVSIREVLKTVDEVSLDEDVRTELIERLKTL